MASRRKPIRAVLNYKPTYSYRYRQPRLTLVTTGADETDFFTEEVLQVLQTADAVVYDAATNPELLRLTPLQAPKFDVSKPLNGQPYTQDQINTLLVDLAFVHGHVVRLKRREQALQNEGIEELAYAEMFNISTALVHASYEDLGQIA